MANTQLVDYIKGQFAAGVPREGIIGSLRAAGWEETDIVESMKVTEASMPVASGEVKPAGSPSFVAVKPVTSSVTPATAVKPAESSPQFPPSKMFTDVEGAKKPAEMASSKSDAKMSGEMAVMSPRGGGMMGGVFSMMTLKKAWLAPGVMGVVILGLVIGLWFTYQSGISANAALTAQTQTDQTTIAGLESQVAQLTGKNTSLTSDRDNAAQSLKAAESELAFFVLPSGVSATATVPFSVKGTLGGTAALYTLTTAKDGITLNFKNSKSPDLAAVLKALVSPMVEITGTHLPASRDVTVTSVNGTAIPSAVPVVVAPASSTAPTNPAVTSPSSTSASTTVPSKQ